MHDNQPHLNLTLTDAKEVATLCCALSLLSSIGVGQLDMLYWALLKPGLVPANPDRHGSAAMTPEQNRVVVTLIHDLKEALGYAAEECLPLNHPDVPDLARTADVLERRIRSLQAST